MFNTTTNKVMAVIILLLALALKLTWMEAQVYKADNSRLETLNKNLVTKVENLTVNVKNVAALNKSLSEVVTKQNEALLLAKGAIDSMAREATKNKQLIKEAQARGKNFTIVNESKNAAENMQYLRLAAPILVGFNPRMDDGSSGDNGLAFGSTKWNLQGQPREGNPVTD